MKVSSSAILLMWTGDFLAKKNAILLSHSPFTFTQISETGAAEFEIARFS